MRDRIDRHIAEMQRTRDVLDGVNASAANVCTPMTHAPAALRAVEE